MPMQPRPRAETCRPLRPSVRVSMTILLSCAQPCGWALDLQHRRSENSAASRRPPTGWLLLASGRGTAASQHGRRDVPVPSGAATELPRDVTANEADREQVGKGADPPVRREAAEV